MLFFPKKIRTKSREAHFGQKFKNIKKCWDPKTLRTFEAQPIFTGSYKKKECSMIQSERGGGKGSERSEIVLWTATAIYKILNNG